MKKILAILVLSAFAGTTFAAAVDSAKPAKTTKKIHHKKHVKAAKTTDSAKAAK
jgi:Ni/Co efflux regulator RcnB